MRTMEQGSNTAVPYSGIMNEGDESWIHSIKLGGGDFSNTLVNDLSKCYVFHFTGLLVQDFLGNL